MIASAARQRGLRQRFLRRFPRFELTKVQSRTIQCEPLRSRASRTELLTWDCSSSPNIAAFECPSIKGTLFRRGRQVGQEDEPTAAPRPDPTGTISVGEQATRTNVGSAPIGSPTSLAYLYELLHPPLEEAASDLSSFSELYGYQKLGVQFLLERTCALLADDMGLGKTVQCAVAIAVLLKQERIRRGLIICPKSILRQWQAEAKRWGGLDASIVNGTPHEREFMWKYYPGILLASPGIVLNDIDVLKGEDFDVVVCDDVSMLKNPGKITTAIRSIPRQKSWCLNGTPLENKPEDLANVMEFVKAGLFSNQERQRAPRQKEMERRIVPYFLRRRKADHLNLPDKVSVGPLVTELEGAQLRAYHDAEAAKWSALQESGIKVTKIHIFTIISALIRLCNVHLPTGTSAKFELLNEELEQVLSDPANKAVVFAQDVDALKFLQGKLSGFDPVIAHGQLSDRNLDEVFAKFRGTSNLLLASVKAFSKGLNLQHASYVFHFDRTWNPTWERQAEDRCHRLGQSRTVLVYRYLVRNTVEERISQVLAEKNNLFEIYINAHSQSPEQVEQQINSSFTLEELMRIVKPGSVGESA